MTESNLVFRWLSAALFSLCGFLFGVIDGFFYALIAVIVIDYVTGVLYAITQKTLSSEIGFKGIVKKVFIFALVAVGNIIDVYMLQSDDCITRNAVIGFFLVNECISILENAHNLGLPLPQKLVDVLQQLRSSNKAAEDKPKRSRKGK